MVKRVIAHNTIVLLSVCCVGVRVAPEGRGQRRPPEWLRGVFNLAGTPPNAPAADSNRETLRPPRLVENTVRGVGLYSGTDLSR